MFMDFMGLLFLYLPPALSLGGPVPPAPLTPLHKAGTRLRESALGELQVDMNQSAARHSQLFGLHI